MSDLLCWNCGENLIDVPLPISRHASCPKCFNELHCCRLCLHNDQAKTTRCLEDRAEPPLQKENANFCEFFSPKFGAYENVSSDPHDDAKVELDSLFGTSTQTADDSPPSPKDKTRSKLDDLFD